MDCFVLRISDFTNILHEPSLELMSLPLWFSCPESCKLIVAERPFLSLLIVHGCEKCRGERSQCQWSHFNSYSCVSFITGSYFRKSFPKQRSESSNFDLWTHYFNVFSPLHHCTVTNRFTRSGPYDWIEWRHLYKVSQCTGQYFCFALGSESDWTKWLFRLKLVPSVPLSFQKKWGNNASEYTTVVSLK